MAHPAEVSVHERVAREIQKARAAGKKFNACPCGCTEQQLNEHGYCRHLIGWSNDGKFYEPRMRVRRTGLDGNPDGSLYERVGNREQDREAEPYVDEDGNIEFPTRAVLKPVLPTHIKVSAGYSWRIYEGEQVREIDPPDTSLAAMMKKVEYLGNQVEKLVKENQDLKSKQTELEEAATKPAAAG